MEEIILRENSVFHLGQLTLGASLFWENGCVISVLSPPPERDYRVKQGDLIPWVLPSGLWSNLWIQTTPWDM